MALQLYFHELPLAPLQIDSNQLLQFIVATACCHLQHCTVVPVVVVVNALFWLCCHSHHCIAMTKSFRMLPLATVHMLQWQTVAVSCHLQYYTVMAIVVVNALFQHTLPPALLHRNTRQFLYVATCSTAWQMVSSTCCHLHHYTMMLVTTVVDSLLQLKWLFCMQVASKTAACCIHIAMKDLTHWQQNLILGR